MKPVLKATLLGVEIAIGTVIATALVVGGLFAWLVNSFSDEENWG